MAHLAELGALTDELVTVITSTSPTSQPKRFKYYRDHALRGVRNRDHLQTNHFAVEEQLRGYVERFAVVGRDGLSEALRQRLDSLSLQTTRWTPEILHLLLELSDQPVKKSSLRALDRLRAADADPGLNLTWDDIAKEDGWAQDRAIWKNVNFADSSDDEHVPTSQSPEPDLDDSPPSSVVESGQRTAQDLILPPASQHDSALSLIERAQEWRHHPQPRDAAGRPMKIPVSEYQILRESLFLLKGLPTDLFGPDCTPVPKYQLSDVSWDTYRALTNSFAEYGRTVLPLRKFVETSQDVPLVQSFQDSVCQCLRQFDKEISRIEARYVDIQKDTVVSLIALQDELRPHLVPLAGLSTVVRQLQEERYAHSFRCLELLYDATCITQLSGDLETYSYLGEIFFDCFRVYIRPIREWMEGGKLTPGDKTFFVAESSASVPLYQTWSDKFNLRKSPQGQLHAPRFLQPAVRKIFNTGKSIVVLKHLDRFEHHAENDDLRLPEPPLDFQSICGSPDFTFAPFAELFDGAFDRWVQSKHLSTSSNLQSILFESCGLRTSLDALEHVYFMRDGALADIFTSSVFASLDALSTTWTDRFTLTELAQEAWSPCPSLESYRLSASVDAEHVFRSDPERARRSVRNSLPGVRLSYKLAWPVQLIITRSTITHYQSLFTLLLQLRRAATALSGLPPPDRSRSFADEPYTTQALYSLRARLLWFTTTLHSYLTTLVLTPETARMRAALEGAGDIDGMIATHTAFSRQVADEALLGPKLEPIRACVLDVLDLAVRLEDARRADEERVEPQAERYAAYGTPARKTEQVAPPPPPPPSSAAKGVYVSKRDKEREEDETILFGEGHDFTGGDGDHTGADVFEQHSYAETLASVRADFDRHLRFIASGLRGVARASTDAAAAKWDILAEMLEMGIKENPRQLV